MISLSTNSLLNFFQGENLPAKVEKSNGQIYIPLEIHDKEVLLFFRILGEGTLLQLIAYVPIALQEESFNEMARFLHIVNKELDIPGFGMDEQNPLVFYRLVVPALDKEVSKKLLKAYIHTIKNALTFFFAGVEAAKDFANESNDSK